METIRVGLSGTGRMGRAIVDALDASEDLTLAAVWVRDKTRSIAVPDGVVVSSNIERVAGAADVVVDFSLPAGTDRVTAAAARGRKPLVCGVSGLGEAQLAALDEAAKVIPVVYDRNMSIGIAVLERLVREAAGSLGSGFEAEIHETHHVHKLDAPSGTALKLGEAVAAARGQAFDRVAWYEPKWGSRPARSGDIRFFVERRGEVAGDHAVVLESPTERLALSHSVTTRGVFADGALRAAAWVVGRAPGRYVMSDVLFGQRRAE